MAMHFTRPDYDSEDEETTEFLGIPVKSLPRKTLRIIEQCADGGEPLFILRGKDILSLFALVRYEELVEMYNGDHLMAQELREIIEEFKTWQRANPQLIRLPD